MGEEIKVFIEKDGTLTFRVSGISGYGCLQATEAIEKETGEVVERRRTREFYQQARNVAGIRNLDTNR
jgi:hypothetical protein